MIDEFCATSFHYGPFWHKWFGEVPQRVWKPNNPLAPELNTQFDVQQTILQRGIHNKGHHRPLAVPIIHCFEYRTVWWVHHMIRSKDLIYWNVKLYLFYSNMYFFRYLNFQQWRTNLPRELLNFWKTVTHYLQECLSSTLCVSIHLFHENSTV